MGRLQRQQLADKKKKGNPKLYKQCEECLYILNTCILCKNGNEFFDRENTMYQTISTTIIEDSVVAHPFIVNVSRNNRVATQIRDGCNF